MLLILIPVNVAASGLIILSETINRYSLVITKGYGVQATMIEDQNTFAPTLCFAQVSRDRWSKHV